MRRTSLKVVNINQRLSDESALQLLGEKKKEVTVL